MGHVMSDLMIRRAIIAVFTLSALCGGAAAQSFSGYPAPGQMQLGQGGVPPIWQTLIGPLSVNQAGVESFNLNASGYMTGVLPMAQGGCNAALTPSPGALLYTTAIGCAEIPPPLVANAMLLSGFGVGKVPGWSTAIWASTYAASSILYANGSNNVQGLAPCNGGVLGYSSAGVPICATTLPSALTIPSPTFTGTVAGTGTIPLSILAPIGANTILGQTAAGEPVALTINGGSSCTSALIWTNGTGFGCNTLAGTGTVTSVATGNGLSGGTITSTGTLTANVDGATITDSGGPLVVANTTVAGQTCTPGSTCGLAVPVTNSLSGDVSLSNTGTYFAGPSAAQGSTGTWCAWGNVTVLDTGNAASFNAKLWDGTTVIDSGNAITSGANGTNVIHLSGCLASPAGNLRISVEDATTTTGKIKFNASGNSMDGTITAIRVR